MFDLSKLSNNRTLMLVLCGGAATSAAVLFLLSRRKKQIDNDISNGMELVGEVSALHCYPVKSVQGVSHDVGFCTFAGMRMLSASDRQFVVVRENGDFITQRQNPRLAGISTTCEGDTLILQANGMPDISVPLHPKYDENAIVPCRVWESSMHAQDCGSDVSEWLNKYLQESGLRMLVKVPDITKRSCMEKNATKKDQLSFQDEGPFHLATEESLNDLLQRIGSPANEDISINNFRPNIVVKGTPKPWDEDEWSHVQIGKNLHMKVLVPMTRCLLTTVDRERLEKRKNGEPLKTLKRIFPEVSKSSPAFGISLGVELENTIRVGDPVYVKRKSK